MAGLIFVSNFRQSSKEVNVLLERQAALSSVSVETSGCSSYTVTANV